MFEAEVDESFFIPTIDMKEAAKYQTQVGDLRRNRKELKNTYFTTMKVYEKDKLIGIRVFRDK